MASCPLQSVGHREWRLYPGASGQRAGLFPYTRVGRAGVFERKESSPQIRRLLRIVGGSGKTLCREDEAMKRPQTKRAGYRQQSLQSGGYDHLKHCEIIGLLSVCEGHLHLIPDCGFEGLFKNAAAPVGAGNQVSRITGGAHYPQWWGVGRQTSPAVHQPYT
jgi:hypothetical protein